MFSLEGQGNYKKREKRSKIRKFLMAGNTDDAINKP